RGSLLETLGIIIREAMPKSKSTPMRKSDRRPSTKPKSKRSSVDTLEILLELMRMPGVSCEEAPLAEFVKAELLRAGAPGSAIRFDDAHRRTPRPGSCGNLTLKLKGTLPGPRRLLMAHLDTVPVCVGAQPVRRGDQVVSRDPRTGVGADNRAGVTVVLQAALRLLRSSIPHPPLTFLWTVQEEIGLLGARHARLALLGNPGLAFNWDGSLPHAVTIGATGGYRMAIEIRGIASHAGNAPEKGVSAIAIASCAIADLHRGGWHGKVEQRGKLGTSNVGIIQGGDATNVVTDRVTLRAEARSHDPRFRARIVEEIERSFRRASKEIRASDGSNGSVHFEGDVDYEAFRLDAEEPCVRAAQAAVRAVGLVPELRIANGGLDANWLSARGIPTVTLGCGQRNPHMTTEALELPDFKNACEIAWHLATGTEHAEHGT
ncbi:MAG TPA: M20/M25/M40 family metallo-hydrolase, partial [Pirellulaceae bacterium]